MYKLDVYEYGSHTRVRLHHHPAGADERCDSECEEVAVQRAYHERGESPRDHRNRVALAVVAALMSPTISNQTFMWETGHQTTLPGL